jgi:hypothetical protein
MIFDRFSFLLCCEKKWYKKKQLVEREEEEEEEKCVFDFLFAICRHPMTNHID